MLYDLKEFCETAAFVIFGLACLACLPFVVMHVIEYEDQPTAAEIYARDSEELLEERIRAAREADEARAGLEEPFSN